MNDTTQEKALLTTEFDTLYSINSLTFSNPCQCELHDGQTTISTTICDEIFNRNIESGFIRFAKGDLLHCHVKQTQWKSQSGLKINYEVLAVKDHILADKDLADGYDYKMLRMCVFTTDDKDESIKKPFNNRKSRGIFSKKHKEVN